MEETDKLLSRGERRGGRGVKQSESLKLKRELSSPYSFSIFFYNLECEQGQLWGSKAGRQDRSMDDSQM